MVHDVTSSDDGALHPDGGYSLNSLYEGEGGSLVSSPCDEEEEGVTPGGEGAHPSALHGTNSPRLTLILLCSAQVRFLLLCLCLDFSITSMLCLSRWFVSVL